MVGCQLHHRSIVNRHFAFEPASLSTATSNSHTTCETPKLRWDTFCRKTRAHYSETVCTLSRRTSPLAPQYGSHSSVQIRSQPLTVSSFPYWDFGVLSWRGRHLRSFLLRERSDNVFPRVGRNSLHSSSAVVSSAAAGDNVWPERKGEGDSARLWGQQIQLEQSTTSASKAAKEGSSNGATTSAVLESSLASASASSSLPAPIPRFIRYKNRFLQLAKINTAFNDAVQSLLRDELLRRVLTTILLLVLSRVGCFIPLPGFERNLIPQNFLYAPAGGLEEMMDHTSELDLSFFQLGIMPYIYASMMIQVLALLHPYLTQLRKEDGHRFMETVKKWTSWTAIALAAVYSTYVAATAQPYSLYAEVGRVQYFAVTVGLLTLGSMAVNTISERITASGLGNGSSLLICVSILAGYADSLHVIISALQAGLTHVGRSVFFFVGFFLFATAGAVFITEGMVKVPLEYYDFELAGPNSSGPEAIEPYIPFNINPGGMGPVMFTGVLLAGIGQLLSFVGSTNPLQALRAILPPAPGESGVLHYTFQFLFIFALNQQSLTQPDQAQEVANYLSKIGARVRGVKPGSLTVKYVDRVQHSARFRGGLLLASLVTISSLVDRIVLGPHKGVNIGFTSTLIIVGTIVSLKKTVEAYRQLPRLQKILAKYKS